ncbi:MAG TPA: glycosyltransferase family 4 protein, partial [Thermodesulfobacteriota bacterium]|nr:glycosyltransferase family 4 protein [Thermodesulfobacteriota bacterium]
MLIVALDFKPMTGGVAEYTHQIALHLQLSGDNVVVLSKNTDGDKEFDSTCPYTVIRYDYDRHLKSGVVPLCRASYKAIKGVIRERQIDAVISNNLQIAHIFWLASKLRSIPFCIFTHGTEVNRRVALGKDFRQVIEFFNEGIKRLFVLKRADKVFCNSSFTRRVVENLGVSYNKTAILHPGIPSACLNSNSSVVKSDLDTATRKLQFDNKKVILTLGRVIERKGIDLVIRAMQIVREKVP